MTTVVFVNVWVALTEMGSRDTPWPGRTKKSELLSYFQLNSSFYIKMPVVGLQAAMEGTLQVPLRENQRSSCKVSSEGSKTGRASFDSVDFPG